MTPSDMVARTIWNTYRVLRDSGSGAEGEYVTEGVYARKSVCECGFPFMRGENVPLGKTYLIVRKTVVSQTVVCHGCLEQKTVRVALCLADEQGRKVTRMVIDCLDFKVQP